MFEDFTLTSYAPATRYTNGQLESQSKTILNNKQLVEFVESVSQMVLILNKYRQVVYANKNYQTFCDKIKLDPIIGTRPGEVFSCKNVFKASGGCGTSSACKSCGSVNAILESQKGQRSTKECQVLTTNNDALDLRVTATPLSLDGEKLTIFSVIDISAEKRRRSLERVFIHDILNSAGAIQGLSSIIKEINDVEELKEVAGMIDDASKSLIEEIQSQREINSAERGDLKPSFAEMDTTPILIELQATYSKHESNFGKSITIDDKVQNSIIKTDRVLLKRILGNMIKNAIEINVPNDSITLNCYEMADEIVFSVHNYSVISEKVQEQLFKRFYSTKGAGRGLGTYSMKLLGEKYLNGKVDCISTNGAGTTFFIRLPK